MMMEPNAIRKACDDENGMRSRYLSYGADLDLLFRKVSAFLLLRGYNVQSDHRRLTLVAVQEKALTVIKVTFALRIVGEPDDFTLDRQGRISDGQGHHARRPGRLGAGTFHTRALRGRHSRRGRGGVLEGRIGHFSLRGERNGKAHGLAWRGSRSRWGIWVGHLILWRNE